MSAEFEACRRSCLLTLCGAFLCVLLYCAPVFANSLPEDAPILMSQSDSTVALAGSPTKMGVDTSVRVFQPGGRTRITLFVTNLDLLENEGATAFRAEIEDAQHYRYPLEIVSFEPTTMSKWVYALTLRLNDGVGDLGDVLMRVTWRGMTSNRVRISIGHEGGKIDDDPGSVPTPYPIQPVHIDWTQERGSTQNRGALPWTGDRVRFMEQAAFGVNSTLEMRVRRLGYSTWLEDQMEEKRDSGGGIRFSTYPYPPVAPVSTIVNEACPDVAKRVSCTRDNYSMYPLQNWFFREALYGEDQQLRRRVSWALSQILVVGGRETVQSGRMLRYVQILDKHAFGDYRQLLKDMTLSPAMGNYLDMAISTKTNPNENYAREILQLFSIGVDMLNQDGTPMLDGQGNRIPSYNQETVNNFTKVFTGWTFCEVTAQCPNRTVGVPNYTDPMLVNPANHDTTQKNLLNYPGATPIIPAGQTPAQDLEAALNNIYSHPNVAPFISKLLIQQLVTSNPTPAYVGRVAAVFNDNGRGSRGDLKSVVRAILLDPEARGNLKTDPDYGKLREPVLYIASILRPFNPQSQALTSTIFFCNGQSDGIINGSTLILDQDVFNPPTVFNYYNMDYIIPNTPLAGPEFGIFSTGTALKRPNFVNQFAPPNSTVSGGVTVSVNPNNPEQANYIPCGTRIVLTNLQALAMNDLSGAELVDTLNREMMHGSMSAQMRSEILTAVQNVLSSNPLKRAETALYLVATSSQYQVQR
jgi:uncharacterized protein (DUF1800 family)